MEQARQFARGPYLQALAQGDKLPAAEFDAMAAKVAGVYRAERRVCEGVEAADPARRGSGRSCCADEERILGRYDARFRGMGSGCGGRELRGMTRRIRGSVGCMSGRSTTTFSEELKYMSAEPYYLQGPGMNQAWDFKHRPGGSGRSGGGGGRGEQTAAGCGDRPGGCDAEESAAAGVFGEWLVRPGDAVLWDGV